MFPPTDTLFTPKLSLSLILFCIPPWLFPFCFFILAFCLALREQISKRLSAPRGSGKKKQKKNPKKHANKKPPNNKEKPARSSLKGALKFGNYHKPGIAFCSWSPQSGSKVKEIEQKLNSFGFFPAAGGDRVLGSMATAFELCVCLVHLFLLKLNLSDCLFGFGGLFCFVLLNL